MTNEYLLEIKVGITLKLMEHIQADPYMLSNGSYANYIVQTVKTVAEGILDGPVSKNNTNHCVCKENGSSGSN